MTRHGVLIVTGKTKSKQRRNTRKRLNEIRRKRSEAEEPYASASI